MMEKSRKKLPAGWEMKTLGEVAKIIAGQSPEGKYYNSEGIGLPFYQGKKEFTAKYLGEPVVWTSVVTKEALKNDILMSVRAPVGPINMATQTICIGRGLAAIRSSKLIDKEYLFYFLLKNECEIIGNEGAVFNSISKIQIENINTPVPSLSEQQRIVAKLDDAFAEIEAAKANIERNLQNCKEVFQSELNAVFEQNRNLCHNRTLGDKELLLIIDGDRGRNYPKKEDFLHEGYCLFLNTGNVRPNGFDFSSTAFVSEERDNLLRNGKLQRYDVILTTRGTIGNVAVYDDNVPYENIRINSGMLIFRPNIKEIIPEYLYEIFRSSLMKEQIRTKTTGAAQPQLPISTLVNFVIPVPINIDIQKKIIKSIQSLSKLQINLEQVYQQKLASLEELKKSILKKAFSGELI